MKVDYMKNVKTKKKPNKYQVFKRRGEALLAGLKIDIEQASLINIKNKYE